MPGNNIHKIKKKKIYRQSKIIKAKLLLGLVMNHVVVVLT